MHGYGIMQRGGGLQFLVVQLKKTIYEKTACGTRETGAGKWPAWEAAPGVKRRSTAQITA